MAANGGGAAAGGHDAAAQQRAGAAGTEGAAGRPRRCAAGDTARHGDRPRPPPPRFPGSPLMRAQRGAALVLVMWLVALLTALIGAYAATARIEYMQGRGLHRGVVAESAARAGLEYAMVRLQSLDPAF